MRDSVQRYIRSMRGGPRIPRNPQRSFIRNKSVLYSVYCTLCIVFCVLYQSIYNLSWGTVYDDISAVWEADHAFLGTLRGHSSGTSQYCTLCIVLCVLYESLYNLSWGTVYDDISAVWEADHAFPGIHRGHSSGTSQYWMRDWHFLFIPSTPSSKLLQKYRTLILIFRNSVNLSLGVHMSVSSTLKLAIMFQVYARLQIYCFNIHSRVSIASDCHDVIIKSCRSSEQWLRLVTICLTAWTREIWVYFPSFVSRRCPTYDPSNKASAAFAISTYNRFQGQYWHKVSFLWMLYVNCNFELHVVMYHIIFIHNDFAQEVLHSVNSIIKIILKFIFI